MAYPGLGEYDKNIQFLEQLVGQDNSDNLPRLSVLDGTYEKGLAIEPHNLDLKSNLALAHALNDQYDQAISLMCEVTNALEAQHSHLQNKVLILAIAGENLETVAFGMRHIGKTETQDVMQQASAVRVLTDPALFVV